MPTITLKWATITTVNDDDSSTYNGSNNSFNVNSYNRTRSELEAKVDRIVAKRLEIDWRRHVVSSAWK
jgi:hypothetical protein